MAGGRAEREDVRHRRILAALTALLLVIGISAAIALRRPGSHPTLGLKLASQPAPTLHAVASETARVSAAPQSDRGHPTTTTVLGRPVGPALPTPDATNLPTVAPLGTLRHPDAVVTRAAPITAQEQQRLVTMPGVSAVEEVDTGTVNLAGAQVSVLGVDPGTFRAFTPQASATEDRLWQYLAGGSLVSSYDMATDRGLTLGAQLPIAPPGGGPTTSGWLGALASIGLPDVDLLVDHDYSSRLGLEPDTGLVISAPQASGYALQGQLQQALPGASVELLDPGALHAPAIAGTSAPASGGPYLSTPQVSQILAAALSRVGDAYVWGGTGPNVFDCSGLVAWSFAQAGISMPRTAAQQALTGPRIPLAQAQPGDLLFWTYDPNDPGFIDHTAIYLGNGRMVVAPHSGADVEFVAVPTADFAGAVHVALTDAASVGGPRVPAEVH